MQTPTHFLVTAFLGHRYKSKCVIPVHMPALLTGAILPDIPFTLLTGVYTIYYRWFAPLPVTDMSVMEYLHLILFFQDPLWITAHNFFHSLPINLAVISSSLWLYRTRGGRWALGVFWLALSMLFHTLIDIATHQSDGPLMFFPFNWTYRFPSPISYWEAEHYGYVVILLESLVNIVILVYFFVKKRQQPSLPRVNL